jgi:hypothetical protein
MANGTCAVCGSLLPPSLRRPFKYCSGRCRTRAYKQRHPERSRRSVLATRECEVCGKTFQPRHGRHATCSPECREAKARKRQRDRPWRTVACPGCGGPMHPRAKSCRTCQARKQLDLKPCEQCGVIFQPKPKAKNRPPQRFCSFSCAAKWKNAHGLMGRAPVTPEHRKTRALAKARKRRLLLNAVPWDGITDDAIRDRDHWMCRMPVCIYGSRRIYRSRKYPDGRSPSIDHIVPLSLGGSDTALNKRASHLGCNMARKNNLDDQGIIDFGADMDSVPRFYQARQPRLCLICDQPLANGRCDLHMRIFLADCATCGKPVTSRSTRRTYCPECRRTAIMSSYLRSIKQRPAHQRGLDAQAMRDDGMTWDEIANRLGYSGAPYAAAAASRAIGKRSASRTTPYERQHRVSAE